MKKYTDKISKGYRLKKSTHNLIKNLKDLTESSIDEVISASCRLYMKDILNSNNGNLKTNSYENTNAR